MKDYCFLSQKLVAIFYGGLGAAYTLSLIIVMVYGASLTIAGSITPGALTSFLLYCLTGMSIPFLHAASNRILAKILYHSKLTEVFNFFSPCTNQDKKPFPR